MELIRSLRERQQTNKQQTIQREAEEIITVSDFDNSLFIAYQGTPLIAIEDNWTPKDILEKLSIIRQNYMKARQSYRGAKYYK